MPLEGSQLGRYRLLRLLGSGGMGEVYLGEDTHVNRQVAIKVMRVEASPYPNSEAAKEATRLFQREVKAIASLNHPHILALFDYGEQENPSLPDLLLSDFGIAKFTTASASVSQTSRGTPIYMAPEQWSGQPTPATDQYALAVMTYQLLVGVPPFQGRQEQVMYLHFHGEPKPPSTLNPHLSKDIDSVLLHALAKKPEERFASISAFSRALQQALIPDSPQRLPTPSSSSTPSRPLPNDMNTILAISEAEARTGTSRLLNLPGGQQVPVSVPANVSDGQVIRLEGSNTVGGIGGAPCGREPWLFLFH